MASEGQREKRASEEGREEERWNRKGIKREEGTLLPRPCGFITCNTKFANFVLQATNAQGLGTRLGRE